MNRIRIGELKNQCRFLGSQEDVAFLASELRQLSTADLPAAIGDAVSRRLDATLNREGVYRIRRLRLNLALTRREFSTRNLGGLLAEQLVEALRSQLEQPGEDFAYFPSQAEFIAQLMGDLLLRESRNLWMYEDYLALRHLIPEEAVVQLLLPRKDELGALLASLQRRGVLAVLLRELSLSQAGQLWRQWLGADITGMFQVGVVPEPDDLVAAQSWLLQVGDAATEASTPLLLVTLRHSLHCLAGSQCQVSLEAVLWAAAQRLFLYRYPEQVAAVLADTGELHGDGGPAAAQASVSNAGYVDSILQDLRRWVSGSKQRRAYVLGIVRQLWPDNVTGVAQIVAQTPGLRVDGSRERLLYSRRAGLVLLLPMIISLRLHVCYTMAQLRGALWAAGAAEGEEHSPEEDWVGQLLPDAPQAVPSMVLPAGWRLGLSAERQSRIEHWQAAGNVRQTLAQLLLAQFAARLSGLQHSSDAYLRSQFLHCGGYFIFDGAQIVARLDSIPLFIVLRMAGLAGWHEELPWSKRSFTIDIPS